MTACFAIYDDGYKCFSCGYFKKAQYDFYRPSSSEKTLRVPHYTTNINTFSPSVLSYLYKYGILDSEIKNYKLGCTTDGELIVPVFKGSQLKMAQQRNVSTKQIKTYGKKRYLHTDKQRSSLVLVEDALSAIKVGRIVDSMCLFGTHIKPEVLRKLVQRYKHIGIWLDGDEAGQRAASQIQKVVDKIIDQLTERYSFISSTTRVTTVSTSGDPKDYTTTEITNILKDNKICS